MQGAEYRIYCKVNTKNNPSVASRQLHTCLHVYTREPKERELLTRKMQLLYRFFIGHLVKIEASTRLPCVNGAVSAR